jgi:aspartyl aminopeptidase
MDYQKTNDALLQFIAECPTCYHVTETVSKQLLTEGYTQLHEEDSWNLTPGGRYFTVRNHASLLAFCIPESGFDRFAITLSHSDSPAYKLKPQPELKENGYLRLNTEGYGGMIPESWMDRPLSIAGRVMVDTPEGILQKTLCFDRDLLVIPNVAPHLRL